MKRYFIQWEIDIYAYTPEEAAQEAFKHMQEPGTTATVFKIAEMLDNKRIGSYELIDLSENLDENPEAI